MSQDTLIRLRCTKCKTADIYTTKNPKSKKGIDRKIELKKLCANCGKHQVHKQAKITG